ncbi:hypothetical protein VCR15J2_390049 [Vibrio coralliirubri]|uniref:hypothetical protein n=1 Tax=Vibrio coralliirubri TaxID=1516159 RepID=UPI000634EBA6|nr:hypothetical protein [Vibrio coralliirubri]CDT53155.1 hypothetical protein VCR15J2_390049 [Vibrio coralliirubri]
MTNATIKLSLKSVSTAVEERNAKLNDIIAHNEQAQETEQHKEALKKLRDNVHNAAARKKRLTKFEKCSKEAQKYVFKHCKDHESAVLSTSSIYAFDTLLAFVQNIVGDKAVQRECFFVFFECFTKRATVSARDIQTAIVRKCISQTTKTNYTPESARTWTRNCFHAMNCLGAMSEEKISRESFYTLDLDHVVTKDLLAKTALISKLPESAEIELDETDIERA